MSVNDKSKHRLCFLVPGTALSASHVFTYLTERPWGRYHCRAQVTMRKLRHQRDELKNVCLSTLSGLVYTCKNLNCILKFPQ